jgi:hypothetical protein
MICLRSKPYGSLCLQKSVENGISRSYVKNFRFKVFQKYYYQDNLAEKKISVDSYFAQTRRADPTLHSGTNRLYIFKKIESTSAYVLI